MIKVWRASSKMDLVALQIEVAFEGAGQHLHGRDEDVEGLRKDGDDRVEFDSSMSFTGIYLRPNQFIKG
jgi:hypothetical protein